MYFLEGQQLSPRHGIQGELKVRTSGPHHGGAAGVAPDALVRESTDLPQIDFCCSAKGSRMIIKGGSCLQVLTPLISSVLYDRGG